MSAIVCFCFTPSVFQLHDGGDMMYELRRRKPKPTLLLTQGFFYLAHHIVREELAFDGAITYTQGGNGLEPS